MSSTGTISKITLPNQASTDYYDIKDAGAERTSNKVTSISSSSTNTQYPSAKLLYDQLALKANTSAIPTKVSQLTNDSGYTTNTGTVTSVGVKMNGSMCGTVTSSGVIDLGAVLTEHQSIKTINNTSMVGTGNINVLTAHQSIKTINNTSMVGTGNIQLPTLSDLNDKQSINAKVTAWNAVPQDNCYPSEKLVKDSLDLKANTSAIPTKVSQLTNDSGYTTCTGTVTSVGVKMNGSMCGTVTSSGVIDLGAVLTETPRALPAYETRSATTNLNKTANYGGAGNLIKLIASSSTTTGKPPTDSNVLQLNWDNSGGYDGQIALSTTDSRLFFRSQSNAGTPWSEATKLTNLTGSVQTTSHRRSVIALATANPNANAANDSYSAGTIYFHRKNGLYTIRQLTVSIEDSYVEALTSNSFAYGNLNYNSSLTAGGTTSGYRFCTFKYNNIWYHGIEFFIDNSEHSVVSFIGTGRNIDIFGLDYYSTQASGSVLNQEVYDSIMFDHYTTNSNNLYASKFIGPLQGNASSATVACCVPNSIAFNNSGSGAASGTTFDGQSFKTISYNTIGAAPTVHCHGNISSSGAIENCVAIGSGDGLLIADSSDGGKILQSLTRFGNDETKVLSNKGTWVDNGGDAGVVVNDDEYLFRRSGGGQAGTDGIANITKLEGNTLGWNQIVTNGNFVDASGWNTTSASYTVSNNTATVSFTASSGRFYKGGFDTVQNHTYYARAYISLSSDGTFSFEFSRGWKTIQKNLSANTRTFVNGITTLTSNTDTGRQFMLHGNQSSYTMTVQNVAVIDLTLLFGSGNEPTSTSDPRIADIERILASKPEYNAGELISVAPTGIKTTGFNQWDGTLVTGKRIDTSGTEATASTYSCSNFISVIPSQSYYFKDVCGNTYLTGAWYDANKNFISTFSVGNGSKVSGTSASPSNAQFVRFNVIIAQGYAETCINISGSRNGEYEPYESHILPLPIEDIKDAQGNKLFPSGLNGVGTVRDEVTSRKAVKRFGLVDLGTLTWTSYSTARPSLFYSDNLLTEIGVTDGTSIHGICSQLLVVTNDDNVAYDTQPNKSIRFRATDGRLYVKDETYTTAAAFKAAMSGVMLAYELAEPVEVELPEEWMMSYSFSSYGTEEVLSNTVSSPISHTTNYYISMGDNTANMIAGVLNGSTPKQVDKSALYEKVVLNTTTQATITAEQVESIYKARSKGREVYLEASSGETYHLGFYCHSGPTNYTYEFSSVRYNTSSAITFDVIKFASSTTGVRYLACK